MRPLADFDPFDPEVVQEPHAFFAALRREAPVYRMPNGAYSLISRYRDVRDAALSTDVFSSNLVAVLFQGECLIGQYGPASGGYHSAVRPALGTGGCLVGQTRPIDW